MIHNDKRKPHPRLLLQPDAIPTVVGFDRALRESTGLHGVSFDRRLGKSDSSSVTNSETSGKIPQLV